MSNIVQRENGTWQARIRRRGFPGQSKTFDTLADAEKWTRAVAREMDIGAFIHRSDAERTTFEEAANRYKTEILPKKRSIQQCESVIKILTEKFGKHSLASISAAMISSYRDERLKSVGAQTVVHEINMISRIYKACSLDWGIALPGGSPTLQVRKPKVDGARDRRLEEGEWEILEASLQQCESKVPLQIVEFALETAARKSEILSLTWADVDLKNCTARLRGVEGRETKNSAAFRDVPLSKKAVSTLTQVTRSINKKSKVFATTDAAITQSWKHAIERAKKMHKYDMLKKALRKKGKTEDEADAEIRALIYHKKKPADSTVKMLAEIEAHDETLKDFHFHDLRHEATSRLAEKLQIHELMKVTGHSSTAMLGRYYHPRASDLARKLG
jgi:integrase